MGTTTTVFGLLTWDLVPRWIITLNLDFLNYHNNPTHDDAFCDTFQEIATCETSTLGF